MLEYPDVSHYTVTSLAGAPAAVAKATQGTSNVDPTYANFRKQAAALGIPFSGYHWIDTSDPAAQARHYHDNAAGAPCMWDAEADGATVPRILAATAALKALGGHAWGVYLPHWWWQGHIGSPDLRPLAAAGLVLVSSNYTSIPNAGWVPYGGVTPTVWQYTDHQPLNGVPCDFNRFNGTVEQLAALFNGTASLAPVQPEEDDMHRIRSGVVGDGSIYLVPGYAAPSGKMAAYGLNGATNAAYETAGVKLVQLPAGVSVPACGLYDLNPQPWPAAGSGSPSPSAADIASAVVDLEHDRLAQ